jgi:hypothetical protein
MARPAASYRERRVLLAGDAAAVCVPSFSRVPTSCPGVRPVAGSAPFQLKSGDGRSSERRDHEGRAQSGAVRECGVEAIPTASQTLARAPP